MFVSKYRNTNANKRRTRFTCLVIFRNTPLNRCFQHLTSDHEINVGTIVDKIRGRTQVIMRHHGMIGNSAHDYLPTSNVQRPTSNVRTSNVPTSQPPNVQRSSVQRSTSVRSNVPTSQRPNVPTTSQRPVPTSNVPTSNMQLQTLDVRRPKFNNGQQRPTAANHVQPRPTTSNARRPTFNVQPPTSERPNVQNVQNVQNVRTSNVQRRTFQRPTC